MGEYDKKPAKAAPTAGPSADDRFGPGPLGSNIQSRILKVDVVNDRTRVTIARGKTHGVAVGMEGYVKGAGGPLSELQIEEVRDAMCFAFVEVTPDQLAGHLNVVINPSTMPRAFITKDVSTRVISVAVEGGRTKIIIARGSSHGVTAGMRGQLRSADGREGEDFTIEGTTAMQSFAYVASTVDHVNAHQTVVLHPNASPRAPIQRRANGAAANVDVQATAQAGVAGANSRLPHFDAIQRSFGKHDISNVQAQVGGAATGASQALGAQAYATGNKVAFASAPDLHTAAHEAAHTIQQQRGAVGFQGLGAADDEHERHADAVADAVVAGQSAEPLLDAVSSGGGTTAVQRKAATNESVSHKERSWVRPSTATSESPEHVGSIFFRTKQAQIDSRDRRLFEELAKSYAASAKQNLGQPGKPLGLSGRVVAYADPRRSTDPSNGELSNQRADVVASGVERAMVNATRLDIGNVHLDRVGAGIAPGARVGDEPLAEGNTLAPFRRADIYLDGLRREEVSTARNDEVPVETSTSSSGVREAPDTTIDHDRWLPYVMDGNKKIIEGIAARIAIDVGPASNSGGRAGMAQFATGFVPEEPPWWAGRAARFASTLNPSSMGRSGMRNRDAAVKARLVHDTLLLLRDYKELIYFEEHHLGPAFAALREPKGIDPARLEQHRQTLRYMVFMYSEIEKLAWRVHHASE